MIAPFANLFGYILNFIYNIVNNYGLAIIIFSILIKIILLPLSIKQQKTMKKTTKIQNKLKEIQFKYKNNPEQLNQATMELYKSENMSPFSGCFSGIVQIILLFAVFYLVRSPLTYMKKIDANIINKYTKIVKENDLSTDSAYPEIEVIRELNNIKNQISQGTADFDLIEIPQIPAKFAADHGNAVCGKSYLFAQIEMVDGFDESHHADLKEVFHILAPSCKTLNDAQNQTQVALNEFIPCSLAASFLNFPQQCHFFFFF